MFHYNLAKQDIVEDALSCNKGSLVEAYDGAKDEFEFATDQFGYAFVYGITTRDGLIVTGAVGA